MGRTMGGGPTFEMAGFAPSKTRGEKDLEESVK